MKTLTTMRWMLCCHVLLWGVCCCNEDDNNDGNDGGGACMHACMQTEALHLMAYGSRLFRS